MKNANLSNLDICKLQSAAFESRTANARLERERLENLKVIEKLTAERDAALAREAELVAQVEALKYHINRVAQASADNTGNEPSFSCFHRALDEAHEAVNETPAQCLRDIQSEAAENAIKAVLKLPTFAGQKFNWLIKSMARDEILPFAKKYAERIRKGEL